MEGQQMTINDKFWIVCRDGAHELRATVRHRTLSEASAECARLAAKENARFIILEAQSGMQPKQPEVETFTLIENDLPF